MMVKVKRKFTSLTSCSEMSVVGDSVHVAVCSFPVFVHQVMVVLGGEGIGISPVCSFVCDLL